MKTKEIFLLSLFSFSFLFAQDSLYLYTVFHGENDQDQFGVVENVGDVNGDGFEDLLVGAPAYISGTTSNGYAKLYFGGVSFDTLADMTFRILDNKVNGFGYTIAGGGDLNGDGFSDFAIAAHLVRDNWTGKIYIYFGGPKLDTIPDLEISLQSYFGISMAIDGDINHDGYDDLAIGVPVEDSFTWRGVVYIYYGGPNMNLRPDIIIRSNTDLQVMGASLDYIGDVNNDSIDDLLVGTRSRGDSDEQAYVFFGDKFHNIGFQNCYIFHGENGMATEVSSLGDINGDGFDEFAFSQSRYFTVYFPPFDKGFRELVIYGDAKYGSFSNLTKFPDINRDGFDEIVCNYMVGTEDTMYIIYGSDKNISFDNSIFIHDPENKIVFPRGIAFFSNLVSDTTISIVAGDVETIDYTMHGTGKVVIYNIDMVSSTGEDKTPTIVKDYKLYQNYPNPFGEAIPSGNPTTKIKFEIPQSSFVNLTVYNLLGQRITTLVKSRLDFGLYTVNFNATNLPSGIYLYKIQAGKYSAVKKMVLLK